MDPRQPRRHRRRRDECPQASSRHDTLSRAIPAVCRTQTIALPGPDRNPHISGNLIVFDHFDTTASIPNWDVYACSLVTQMLYRITNTLADETLSDVSVTPDGVARVVWRVLESD